MYDHSSTVPTVIFLHDGEDAVVKSIYLIRKQGIDITDFWIYSDGNDSRQLDEKVTPLLSLDARQLLFISHCPENSTDALAIATWAKSINEKIAVFVFGPPDEPSLIGGQDANIIDGIILNGDPAPTSVSSYLTRLFLADHTREQLQAVAARIRDYMRAMQPEICR